MYVQRHAGFDQLYVGFNNPSEEKTASETREVFPGVYFDLDTEGKLVGIDVVNTEEVLGKPAADLSFSGELVGLKEAAALTGKDKANFLRDFASQPDFPKPVARLASGQVWMSKDIETYVKGRSEARDSARTLRDRG